MSQQEFDSLKNDIHYYWQNLTPTIINNNIITNDKPRGTIILCIDYHRLSDIIADEESLKEVVNDLKEFVNDSLSAISSVVSRIEAKLANCSLTQTICKIKFIIVSLLFSSIHYR